MSNCYGDTRDIDRDTGFPSSVGFALFTSAITASGATCANLSGTALATCLGSNFGSLSKAKTYCSSNASTTCKGIVSYNDIHYPYLTSLQVSSDASRNFYDAYEWTPVIRCGSSSGGGGGGNSRGGNNSDGGRGGRGGRGGGDSGPSPVDATSTDYLAGFNAGEAASALAAASAGSINSDVSAAEVSALKLSADGRTGLIVTSVVVGFIILMLGYNYLVRQTNITSFLTYSVIVALIAYGSFFIYEGVTGDKASSGNLARTPIDSMTGATIPASAVPGQAGVNGGNYAIQWWMYIKDWNTRFGQEKAVMKRGGRGAQNPYVYLHPTENTLVVKVDSFDSGSSRADAAGGGDFTCQLTNVPLQSWFSVGLSVAGRNLDLYIDGKLMRSCMIPGVPITPRGDLQIMPGGGFSGNVIDVYHYARSITPSDAMTFFTGGTAGTTYTSNTLPSKTPFGYSVSVGVTDNTGNVVKQVTF